MPVLPEIEAFSDKLVEIRHDLHTHPEIGFQEHRTATLIAGHLGDWGADEVYTGIGGTGVVAIIKGRGDGNRSVGLRADMDALPMDEETGLPFASTTPGAFHGCGHDGHTAMLLGTARYLAATRNFAGRAVLIFQPAEEGLGGAQAMLDDGLFQRFPCDEVYGLHNNPLAPPGVGTIKPGAAMAGAAFFDIAVKGAGGHAAHPHLSRDPIVIAAALQQSLQTIVSRNTRPVDVLVCSVTQLHAGSTYNVMPDKAVLSGTLRYFAPEVRDMAFHRVRKLCEGIAVAYEVSIDVDLREVFDILVNDPALSEAYRDAAADVIGDGARLTEEMVAGSEDFSTMLQQVPGAFLRLGHSGDVPLHNPAFVLGDEILPVGASIMARIVERRLPL